MPGWGLRLFRAVLILLVSVPQFRHRLASLASSCCAPRTECWSASRRCPSASAALQCLYSEVFLVFVQWLWFLFS